ncbi:MAG: transporter substrate-binding domain-containing protein [Planctomycetaceae bacterium]
MKAWLLFVALSAGACTSGEGGGGAGESTLAMIAARGELVVGIEPGFVPFEVLRDDGRGYEGFDIDLMTAFARDLGVKLRVEAMGWDSLPPALRTGKVDMVWSGMTATVERAKTTLFSDFYFETRLCFLVSASSGIARSGDVHGKRLVVKLATTGESAATEHFADCAITKLDDENLCAQEVVTGRADAFLYDRFSILKHHEMHRERTRVVEDWENVEPYAVAMRPGDFDLWRAVNLFLRRIRTDGRYNAIHARHFGRPPDDAR